MRCTLKEETTHKVWQGRTFFTTSSPGEMLPAAVYFPPNHPDTSRSLNVLLFFHGFYVGGTDALINSDNTRLCEQVLDAGRDVVLVAPWLGAKWGKGNGVLHTDRWADAGYTREFLRAILAALPDPPLASNLVSQTPPGVDAISGAGPVVPRLAIRNLVLACHSGGGVAMRNAVQSLGDLEGRLRECVGLDCLYNDGDAKFWSDRAQQGAPPAYFYFGPSTVSESIKLYLMAQGRVDALGNERKPPGQKLMNLLVRPGHISSFMYGGVTTNVSATIDQTMDDLIARTPPSKGTPFAEQAAANFAAGYIYPFGEKDERGGIHYFIARAFLRERLGSVALT